MVETASLEAIRESPQRSASNVAVLWCQRHWRSAALAIALTYLAACLCHLHRTWLAVPDSVKYVYAARSLSRGDGYTFNRAPEVKHPPGLSLLLAPLFWIDDEPFGHARLLMIFFAGAALYSGGLVLRRALGETVSLAAMLCLAASVELWWSAQFVLTEFPYTLLQNMALLSLMKTHRGDADANGSFLAFGIWSAAAILFRPLALALVAACGYVILRRWIAGRAGVPSTLHSLALGIGPPLLVLVSWRAYCALRRGLWGPPNLDILWSGYTASEGTGALGVLVTNVQDLIRGGLGLMFGAIDPAHYPSVQFALWAGLAMMALPGAVLLLRRGVGRAEPVWAFVCAYLGILALWPLTSGASARLCWPVVVFLVGALMGAYRAALTWFWPKRGPQAAVVAMLAAVAAGQSTLGRRAGSRMREQEAAFAARWTDLCALRDDVSAPPEAVWAHLNLRAATYVLDRPRLVMELSWSKNPRVWTDELQRYRPSFVVIPTTVGERENSTLFVETLKRVDPEARRVAGGEAVSVYEISPSAPDLTADQAESR